MILIEKRITDNETQNAELSARLTNLERDYRDTCTYIDKVLFHLRHNLKPLKESPISTPKEQPERNPNDNPTGDHRDAHYVLDDELTKAHNQILGLSARLDYLENNQCPLSASLIIDHEGEQHFRVILDCMRQKLPK